MLIYWTLILAAGCYFGLAVWRLVIARTHPGAQYLGMAFAGTAIWAAALLTGSSVAVALAELLRDIAWLHYFYITTRSQDAENVVTRAIAQFCLGLGALAIVRTGLSLVAAVIGPDPQALSNVVLGSIVIRWAFAAVGLLFANALYRSTSTLSGSGFRLIIITLGVTWAYDLNCITMMMLGYPQAVVLSKWRGLVILIVAPVLAIGARRKEHWKVLLSRQATTQSLLFAAIGVYFVVVSSATRAAIWAGESSGDTLKIMLAGVVSLGILIMASMPRPRAYAKTFFIKHLFEHRYDYRSEWLRFSATIADRGTSLLSAEERAIRSLADVTESQGGLLLLVEPANRMVLAGTWHLETPKLAAHRKLVNPEWLDTLIATARIVNLDQIRATGRLTAADGPVPAWLVDEPDLWIAVPLVRSRRLVGIIALGHPSVERELDWEDFDLLKVIAQQVTVHLTDAESHSKLEEARRFDEFNRRFAFIIHDLKNVVSQLSLVSSNAVEHGSNPKFQASMVKTLGNSTAKMTTLLSRLSIDRMATEPNITLINPEDILARLVNECRKTTPISVTFDSDCAILADEEQLAEALGHLLSNAIEASPEFAEIRMSVSKEDGMVVIAVEDQGCGMTPAFIRNELFQPFMSTKPGGFGIGAAEARSIIAAMGGELLVESVEGEGTKFSAIFSLQRRIDVNEAQL